MTRGLDGRHRDQDGRIQQKRSDTLVRTLRDEYGPGFAPGFRPEDTPGRRPEPVGRQLAD
jgi:hypothetical protein